MCHCQESAPAITVVLTVELPLICFVLHSCQSNVDSFILLRIIPWFILFDQLSITFQWITWCCFSVSTNWWGIICSHWNYFVFKFTLYTFIAAKCYSQYIMKCHMVDISCNVNLVKTASEVKWTCPLWSGLKWLMVIQLWLYTVANFSSYLCTKTQFLRSWF